MASKLIRFDSATGTFDLGNERGVTPSAIRQQIADTLRKTRWSGGREVVDFLYVTVTVQYLMEMLDWVEKYGWFWDSFDTTGPNPDHRFDWNHITPGFSYGEAQELKAEARDDLKYADELEADGELVLAAEYRRQAGQLFRTAHALLVTGGHHRR